ncbi:hypothetical protein [Leptothrix cholodnii]|nr:hypothetical protein [Leptothrix cholodnii]
MSMSHAFTRRLAVSAIAVLLGACSTTASVRHIEKPQEPLKIEGLHVAFLQPTFRFDTTDPRFSNARVDEQLDELRQAVLEHVPAGMAPAGIETRARSFALDEDGRPPTTLNTWLKTEQKTNWHLLTVVPSGAHVNCSGGICNLKTNVMLEIRAPYSMSRRWAVELTESAMTSDLSMSTQGASNHYAREMVKALLADVRGPKSP